MFHSIAILSKLANNFLWKLHSMEVEATPGCERGKWQFCILSVTGCFINESCFSRIGWLKVSPFIRNGRKVSWAENFGATPFQLAARPPIYKSRDSHPPLWLIPAHTFCLFVRLTSNFHSTSDVSSTSSSDDSRINVKTRFMKLVCHDSRPKSDRRLF